jgi:hypothetical protein
VKIGSFSNILPGGWWGLIACGIEEDEALTPTPAEIDQVTACLEDNGHPVDLGRLDGYRYLWADDFIVYPTKWINPTQYRVVIGWTDWQDKYIYVRRNLNFPDYDPREILRHEMVHALTGLQHNDLADPFEDLDCL